MFADFISTYKKYIIITFLVSLALTLNDIIITISKIIKKNIIIIRNDRFHKKQFKDLNPNQKKILKEYIDNQTQSQWLSYCDGNVKLLESFGIIQRASTVGADTIYFPYALMPWAWNYLNEHKNILN